MAEKNTNNEHIYLVIALKEQLGRFNTTLENLKIAEYVQMFEKPGRMLWLNLFGGILRGLGIALGASIVFALLLNFLQTMVMRNSLGIGQFIAQIVKIVEIQNGKY